MSRELLKLVLEEFGDGKSRSNISTDLYCEIEEYLEMPEPGPVASINGWYGGYPTVCSINGAVLPVGMALYPPAPARLPLQPPHTTQIDQSARIAEPEKDNNITHENLAWYMAKYHEHLTIIAELEKSEAFLKDAVDAAVKDIKHYRDESESRLEGLMSATEANRRLIDKITFLERQASQGNDMRLASHEGDKRNPQLQSAREPLSDDEIQDIHNEQPSRSTYYEFARAIEAAHGIGVNHE